MGSTLENTKNMREEIHRNEIYILNIHYEFETFRFPGIKPSLASLKESVPGASWVAEDVFGNSISRIKEDVPAGIKETLLLYSGSGLEEIITAVNWRGSEQGQFQLQPSP